MTSLVLAVLLEDVFCREDRLDFLYVIDIDGLKVPYDVELEIWEPTDRWMVRLDEGECITSNAKKVTAADGVTKISGVW